MTLKFLGSFGTKPVYAFGIPGLLSLTLGGMLSLFALGQKCFPPHVRVHRNPLLPLSFLFSGFGLQCIMMGLLAELLMRTYYESQGKQIYVARDILPTNQSEATDDEAELLAPSTLETNEKRYARLYLQENNLSPNFIDFTC